MSTNLASVIFSWLVMRLLSCCLLSVKVIHKVPLPYGADGTFYAINISIYDVGRNALSALKRFGTWHPESEKPLKVGEIFVLVCV